MHCQCYLQGSGSCSSSNAPLPRQPGVECHAYEGGLSTGAERHEGELSTGAECHEGELRTAWVHYGGK